MRRDAISAVGLLIIYLIAIPDYEHDTNPQWLLNKELFSYPISLSWQCDFEINICKYICMNIYVLIYFLGFFLTYVIKEIKSILHKFDSPVEFELFALLTKYI